MPIIQFGINFASAGLGGSVSVTLGASVTSGNALVVIAFSGFGTLSSPSDTLSTVYGSAVFSQSAGGNRNGGAFIGLASASGACTITINGGGELTLAVWEVSGLAATLDVAAGNFTAGAQPPAVTTTASNDLIFLLKTTQQAGLTFTATAPTVRDGQTGSSGSEGAGHLPTTSPGTYTPAFVSSNPSGELNAWNASVAFLSSGGGGGTLLVNPGMVGGMHPLLNGGMNG